ncbi:MAG: UvrD-helicase domain-containing protein, partial [Planctomycetota bacterium]
MSKIFEAGAGTGKTTRLCITFFELYLDKSKNLKPPDIYIISFTEKAVTEIKDRLLRTITILYNTIQTIQDEKLISGNIFQSIDYLNNSETLHNIVRDHDAKSLKEYLTNLYINFEEININTIHSFCSKFLKKFYYEVGLEQDFKICDNEIYKYKVKKIINKFIINSLKNPSRQLFWQKVFTKIEPSSIISIIFELLNKNLDILQNIKTPDSFFQDIILPLAKDLNENQFKNELLKTGYITFDSILYLFYKLICEKPHILEYIKNQVRVILIDEIQDVDPIQYKILWKLCTENNGIIKDKIFLFGDAKQSIYSFRGADVDSYKKFRDAFTIKEQLNKNYRSVKNIVNFTNSMGSFLFGKEYSCVESFINASTIIRENNIELYFFDNTPEGRQSIKELEARFISLKIQELINKHRNKIQYKDIGILIRTIKNLPLLKEEFNKEKIPYIVYGGSEFFKRSEVIGFINMLKTIYMPYDKINIISFYRSIYKFANDEEIFSIFTNRQAPWQIDGSLIRDELLKNKITELILKVLTKMGYIGEYTSEQKYIAYANITKLIEIILSLEEDILFSDLLELFDNFLQKKEQEAIIFDETLDAVRIMTIHKAKGLEFKIVIVPFLDATSLVSIDEKLQLRYILGTTIDKEIEISGCYSVSKENKYYLNETSKEYFTKLWDGKEELNRLFYVAITRAKDLLILSSFPGSKIPQKTFIYKLLDYLNHTYNICRKKTSTGIGLYNDVIEYLKDKKEISIPGTQTKVDIKILKEQALNVSSPLKTYSSDIYVVNIPHDKIKLIEKKWKEREESLRKIITERLFIYPSSVKSKRESNIEISRDDQESRYPATRALLVGQIVHEVLNELDFSKPNIDFVLSKLSIKHNITTNIRKKVENIIKKFVESDVFKQISKHYEILYRELPIIYKKGENEHITGYIDIVLKKDSL